MTGMKPGFFFKEAMRSLRRNAAPSFAAMATVLVTMLVLGVFIPIVQATNGAADEVRSRVLVDVYLTRDATDRQVEAVRQIIADDTKHVKRVEYVSKEQALRQEKKERPEAFELLGSNPLPDLFRITPDSPENVGKLRDELAPVVNGRRTVVDPVIDEVKNRREDTDKINTATKIVKYAAFLLAGLLALASILLIANTIRLSLYSRRREVEVMKLVGATDWFIRWPFVLEGIIVGAMGAVLAVLVLLVFKIALVDPFAADFSLISTPDTMPFTSLVAILLLASIAVSALGSGVSLRRFLKV